MLTGFRAAPPLDAVPERHYEVLDKIEHGVDEDGSIVGDDELFVPAAGFWLRGVMKADVSDGEAAEERAHFGNIVQGQEKLALQFRESLGERSEVLRLKVVVVQLAAVIRRIEVKKRRGPVIPFEDLFIRE